MRFIYCQETGLTVPNQVKVAFANKFKWVCALDDNGKAISRIVELRERPLEGLNVIADFNNEKLPEAVNLTYMDKGKCGIGY